MSVIDLLDKIKKNQSVLAISGDCFEIIFKDFLDNPSEPQKMLLNYIKVFARTNPEQKAQIVKCFKKLMQKNYDKFVGFCGDGANDCSAL